MSWTLGNTLVISGRLQHPAQGNWQAQLQTLDDEAPSGSVALALPGLTLQGTVVGSGVFGGRCTVRVVGGAGKLAARIQGQHFRGASGRLVAEAILGAVGETLDPTSDAPGLSTTLPHWHHAGGAGTAALDQLCAALGCSWWMTPAGQVRLGVLSYPPAAPEGALTLDKREDLRRLTVAMEDEALQPRTTYEGYQLSAVDHELTPTTWRAHARWGSSAHPMDAQLRHLVRHLQLKTIPPLEAEVIAQGSDGSLDLRLLLDEQLRELWELDRGILGVPLALQGCWTVKIAPGARVVLEFLDGDHKKPVVRTLISATILEATLSATTKAALSAPQVDLAEATAPVVRVGDTLAVGLTADGKPVVGTIAIAAPISKVKA